MTDESISKRNHKHTDNCGRTGRKDTVANCRMDCNCWCHRPDPVRQTAREDGAITWAGDALASSTPEAPMCDLCGESEVTVRFEQIGCCDDCAAKELRRELSELCGDICANISRRENGFLTVCLAPFGIEHDHD